MILGRELEQSAANGEMASSQSSITASSLCFNGLQKRTTKLKRDTLLAHSRSIRLKAPELFWHEPEVLGQRFAFNEGGAKTWGQLGAKTRPFQAQNRVPRVVRATDSTGLLVGAVGIEPDPIFLSPAI